MLGCSKLNKEFFSAPLDPTISFTAGKMQVQHGAATYSIESLSTLEKLLAEIRSKKEHPVLRYLVDKSYTAWFARETRVGVAAPKHFQMTGDSIEEAQCLTAGNIKFKNSTCKVLRSINHRSGDFCPSFDSLRIFLAILILNEEILSFKLPKVLIVKELINNNKSRKYKWPISQLKEWVNTLRDNDQLIKMLTKQDADTKTVRYEALSNFITETNAN
ncbi:MAG: hypothetical protein WA877_02035 [Legionella sp.]